MGVTIVSCFLNCDKNIQERSLYSNSKEQWNDAAKFMCDISSDANNNEKVLRTLAYNK